MERCLPIVNCFQYLWTLFYKVGIGLHWSYWAKVHKALKKQLPNSRVKHDLVTLFIPLVLVIAWSVRGIFVLLFLDKLNLNQRVLMFTELFPLSVRKQAEVLILSWSVIYLLVMALDSTRTTKQMAFLNVHLITKNKFRRRRCGLGPEEWIQFDQLRQRLFTLLNWFMFIVIIVSWLIMWILAFLSGAVYYKPLMIMFYATAYFPWVAALIYPFYPLMTTIILLAGFYLIQQKSLQKRLERISHRGNNK